MKVRKKEVAKLLSGGLGLVWVWFVLGFGWSVGWKNTTVASERGSKHLSESRVEIS